MYFTNCVLFWINNLILNNKLWRENYRMTICIKILILIERLIKNIEHIFFFVLKIIGRLKSYRGNQNQRRDIRSQLTQFSLTCKFPIKHETDLKLCLPHYIDICLKTK